MWPPFLWLLCLSAWFYGQVHAQPAGISGKVLGPDGQPIAGAKVYLAVYEYQTGRGTAPTGITKQTESAQDGSFVFGGLETQGTRQRISLAALKDNFGAWGVDIFAGRPTTGLEIRLGYPGEIEGRVVEKAEAENPVREARVWPFLMTRQVPHGPEQYNVPGSLNLFYRRTDPDGRFHLNQMPAGAEVTLYVTHRDYTAARPMVKVGDRNLKISVEKGGSITGRVGREDTGEPVPRVTVSCGTEYVPGVQTYSSSVTTTDEHGCFTLGGLKTGTYWVYLRSDAGLIVSVVALPKRVENVVGGKVTACEDLLLTKGGFVAGKVTDRETGEPIEKAEVSAALVQPRGVRTVWGMPTTVTASDGTYKLQTPPGRRLVRASTEPRYSSRSSERASEREVDVVLGKTIENVNFTVRRLIPQQVKGVVRGPDGQPVPGAIVTRYAFGASVTADDQGLFTLEDLRADEAVRVMVVSPDRALGAWAPVPVQPGRTEPVPIALKRLGKVTGRVEDERGQPVAHVRLWVFDEPSSGYVAESAMSDAEGRFTLALPPGRWLVGLRREQGYVMSDRGTGKVVEIAEGQTGPDIVLKVSKTPVLTGQFVNAKGEPVGAARVTSLSGFPLGPATVNPDGTFAIQATYIWSSLGFYATNSDGTLGALVQVDMEKAKKEPLRVILAEMGEVKGKVEDDEGQPVKHARLWMRRAMSPGTLQAGATDGEGRFAVKLPPGAWRMWAAGPQGSSTLDQAPTPEFQVAVDKPVEGLRFVLRKPRRDAR